MIIILYFGKGRRKGDTSGNNDGKCGGTGAVAEEADHESANEGIPLVSCATDDEVDYQLPNIV